ncbi:hypothetical protein VTO73DRAFT_15580 [Trametes versicolor]
MPPAAITQVVVDRAVAAAARSRVRVATSLRSRACSLLALSAALLYILWPSLLAGLPLLSAAASERIAVLLRHDRGSPSSRCICAWTL